ncbi:AAA family ATPase [Roseateles sp. L2-2]|uniref:AAA family ATPase n=1 Tax=Roseateles sp. L2-2 TaxID=3422597 RepID=UPI003D36D83F
MAREELTRSGTSGRQRSASGVAPRDRTRKSFDIADLILRREAKLLASALHDRPPLRDVLQDLLTDGLAGPMRRRRIQLAEQAIEEKLRPHGLHRYRQRVIDVAGEEVPAWVYFRSSEWEFSKAIDDAHPVLLAVTPEPHRFIRSVIATYGGSRGSRPIFLWTSASGLHEIEGEGPDAVFHPVANAARQIDRCPVRLIRLTQIVEDDARDPENRQPLFMALSMGCEGSGSIVIRGKSTKTWLRHVTDEEKGNEVHLLIDDLDDEDFALDEEESRRLEDEARRLFSRSMRAKLSDHGNEFKTLNFAAVISFLLNNPVDDAIVILCDAHHHLAKDAGPVAAVNARVVKDAFYRLRRMRKNVKLILFAADGDLPNDLREELQRISLPLPTRAEVEYLLKARTAAKGWPKSVLDLGPDGHFSRLVDASVGMTMGEIRSVMDQFVAHGNLQPSDLVSAMHDAKKRSVARSPALEVVDVQGSELQLGGMERLVNWLKARHRIFDRPDAAEAAGIDRRPKGVLLLGIPGAGKSLAAKLVAKTWRLPLIRLDLGAIQDKWVGSSEARIREALNTVVAMSPCVLWIDEIDKGVAQGAGTASHSTDLNVRATLLTWMQEYTQPVFIVATANRISNLPPELMRAGRFDARFFLGCPGASGRKEILSMHLQRRRIDPESLDLDKLVRATHGYTGAEMEQLVLDALYDAFHEDERSRPSMPHFERRLAEIKPLIKTVGTKNDSGMKGGGGLDEVWDLIDQGRVELASSDLLTKAQVMQLIDPFLYRPVYCRKENVAGFETFQAKGERIVMGVLQGGPVAAVMDAGDNWIFVYTSIHFDTLDAHNFKFIDRFETIEDNGIFDTLVVQYGLETVLFLEPSMKERFEKSTALSQIGDLFELAAT